MAGHSKWANIKHRKARQDSKKSKAWSKCSKAIMVAAKNGGPDPVTNLTLRYAIDEAKSENMTKDTIAHAIKKGAGLDSSVTFVELSYEGYGPNGVAVMLDILTDNRNRTASEVPKIFDRAGGKFGSPGCVGYMFTPKGQIALSKEGLDEEKIMDLALEAGAEDVQDEGEVWVVETEPSSFLEVKEALVEAGLEPVSSEVTKIPDNTVACEGEDASKVLRFIDALEDHEDVQKLYHNAEIDEAALGD